MEQRTQTAVAAPLSDNDPDYWHSLIDERAAAEFLGLTDRCLQRWRQKGGGPRYVRLSPSVIRYRRIDLKEHADQRVRRHTHDQGPQQAA